MGGIHYEMKTVGKQGDKFGDFDARRLFRQHNVSAIILQQAGRLIGAASFNLQAGMGKFLVKFEQNRRQEGRVKERVCH